MNKSIIFLSALVLFGTFSCTETSEPVATAEAEKTDSVPKEIPLDFNPDTVISSSKDVTVSANASELLRFGPAPLPADGAPMRVPLAYQLPVSAPIMEGLDSVSDNGVRSRGLTFAALCAQLLAARLHEEPLPVPLSLAMGLDVRRTQVGRAVEALRREVIRRARRLTSRAGRRRGGGRRSRRRTR